MEAIAYGLWFFAAIMSAVQDVIDFNFEQSVFCSTRLYLRFLRFYKWLRSRAEDKYSDPAKKTFKKIFWIIPWPQQIIDAWHTAKFIKLICFYLAVWAYSFFNDPPRNLLHLFINGIFFGTVFWLGFQPFKSVFLLKRHYRENPFYWFGQFFR